MEITQDQHSILRLNNLYFDEFSFKSSGVRGKSKPRMTMSVSFSVNDETGFSVVLLFKVVCAKTYQLSCSLTGVFEVEGGLTDSNAFLRDNAVAILFPYMRSQITLLTSQPGLEPVIIPALNIKKLLHPDE